MNKKFISAILAGALSISAMSISAFATAFTPSSGDTADLEKAGAKTYAIQAGFQAPSISVTIPSAVKAVLNPYGVKVELEDGFTGVGGITSPVYTISNNTTDFGIIVKATATATLPSGTTITDVATDDTSLADDTDHKVYAQVKASVKTDTAPAKLGDGIFFLKEADTAKARELLILTKATEAQGKVTPVEGYFQIDGEVSGKPTKAWSATDKVTLNLILDIEPASAETGKPAETTKIGSGKSVDET